MIFSEIIPLIEIKIKRTHQMEKAISFFQNEFNFKTTSDDVEQQNKNNTSINNSLNNDQQNKDNKSLKEIIDNKESKKWLIKDTNNDINEKIQNINNEEFHESNNVNLKKNTDNKKYLDYISNSDNKNTFLKQKVIKYIYKKLSLFLHPDKIVDEKKKDEMMLKFKILKKAYIDKKLDEMIYFLLTLTRNSYINQIISTIEKEKGIEKLIKCETNEVRQNIMEVEKSAIWIAYFHPKVLIRDKAKKQLIRSFHK